MLPEAKIESHLLEPKPRALGDYEGCLNITTFVLIALFKQERKEY
jgi:hypothetical protein